MPVIDIHSHFFPQGIADLGRELGGEDWPWLDVTDGDSGMIMVGDRPFRPIGAACWAADQRLADMDAHGIDLQVISATPVLFGYARPIAEIEVAARIYNDAALELCSADPARLKALCQVPLQDTDASCRELDRAMDAGHIGVQIGNHVGLANLDDAGIVTFLHHCADRGAAVLVHPWDMMAVERMPRYMLSWLVGMPAETQLSILSLILSGAFERLPRSLRICFAHGGGNFAFQLGRVDNAWRNRDIVRVDCPHPPSTYTDRFYTDSAVFSPGALELLIQVMGEDRVILGSDYPFPLGEQVVGRMIREDVSMTASRRTKLMGANAMAFLGLEETVMPATGTV